LLLEVIIEDGIIDLSKLFFEKDSLILWV
jgi:hypothetical protein